MTSAQSPITGGCLCGAVRFAVEAEPITARTCWCRLCQYLGAGSATVNVLFPSEALTTIGEVRWFRSIADSGNAMRRGFCPTCGTQIFGAGEAWPHLILIRAGALDDPNLMGPRATIWAAQAPDWACIDPALPRHEGQPPPAG